MSELDIQYDYMTNTKGHQWRTNEDGSIDIFGYDAGLHNGPICVLCGYSFCHHCSDGVAKQECTGRSRDAA